MVLDKVVSRSRPRWAFPSVPLHGFVLPGSPNLPQEPPNLLEVTPFPASYAPVFLDLPHQEVVLNTSGSLSCVLTSSPRHSSFGVLTVTGTWAILVKDACTGDAPLGQSSCNEKHSSPDLGWSDFLILVLPLISWWPQVMLLNLSEYVLTHVLELMSPCCLVLNKRFFTSQDYHKPQMRWSSWQIFIYERFCANVS